MDKFRFSLRAALLLNVEGEPHPNPLMEQYQLMNCCPRRPGCIPGQLRVLLFGLLVMAASLFHSGCSMKRFAVNKLGDALAGGGTTFASDDDPELIKSAVPFSLKLME